MDCPGCRRGVLKGGQLTSGLECITCEQCRGSLVSFDGYSTWQEKPRQYASLQPEELQQEPPKESPPKAILCPTCKRIMRKFRFAWDSWENIDACQACQVVWLEKSIWTALEQRHIDSQLLLIFTETWQRKIRKDRAEKLLNAQYLQRFGDVDYQRIQKLRKWICNHPKRAEILDYLVSEDPYQT